MTPPLVGGSPKLNADSVAGNIVLTNEGNLYQRFGSVPKDDFGQERLLDQVPRYDLSQALQGGVVRIDRLLRWEYGLVDKLFGREEELKKILHWARLPDKQPLFLFLDGDGGSGKTRLATEAAAQLRNDGWSVAYLKKFEDADYPPAPEGNFIIIDYPEDQIDKIRRLYRDIADNRGVKQRLRFLMLSRRGPESWENEVLAVRDMCARKSIRLGALDVENAKALIEHALARLIAQKPLNKMPDLGSVEGWLATDESNRLCLYALAAAIDAFLNGQFSTKLTGSEILDELVKRETRRTDGAGQGSGLGAHAVTRLLAVASVIGELSVEQINLLAPKPLGIVTDCDAVEVVDRLRNMPWWNSRAMTLEALGPDELGTRFAAKAFAERPDLAAKWIAIAISIKSHKDWCERLVRVLSAIKKTKPEVATSLSLTFFAELPEPQRSELMTALDRAGGLGV